MSVEMLCECPDGFGLPHSHIFAVDWSSVPDNKEKGLVTRPEDTGWVRVSVNWKAIAKALVVGDHQ